MAAIRIRSIQFSTIPFRRLKSLIIPIAERVTLIAGHNGTGKSTILAFLANGSGRSEKEYVSYFNRSVQANFQEIIHLTVEHDYVHDVDSKPYVLITYDIGGQTLVKKCNVTRRGKSLFRVVPRNDPKEDFDHEGIAFGRDAKVPWPTIYLGMLRMIPIGESERLHIRKSSDTTMHAEDRAYIQKITNELIDTGKSTASSITHQSIAHTKKVSKHADYAYDSRAISLGQDSLSSVVTALASFKKLKREMGNNYPGGLLIVDELDAGFHPRTQCKLLRVLQNESADLDLQVIATTHSLILIQALHEQISRAPQEHSPDRVNYIQDTRNPHLCDGWSFDQIRDDMHVRPPDTVAPKKPVVMLYAEDDEAQFYGERLLRGARKLRIMRATGVNLKILSLKMGHNNLLNLYKADDYFKSVVILVDADVENKKLRGKRNVVRLPGMAANGDKPTPELILYRFIESLIDDPSSHQETWAALQTKRLSSDYLKEHLLDDPDVRIGERGPAKAWFSRRLALIEEWGLVDLWIAENGLLVNDFEEELIRAIRVVHPAA